MVVGISIRRRQCKGKGFVASMLHRTEHLVGSGAMLTVLNHAAAASKGLWRPGFVADAASTNLETNVKYCKTKKKQNTGA